MCFRFLQVAWSFYLTGELPAHDHARVEGLEDEIELAQTTGRAEPVLLGEAIEVSEEREHIHGGMDEHEPGHAGPREDRRNDTGPGEGRP